MYMIFQIRREFVPLVGQNVRDPRVEGKVEDGDAPDTGQVFGANQASRL
jgi:hypothetical protein